MSKFISKEVVDKEKPRLMTYSYFYGKGALSNPVSDYIEDMQVVHENKKPAGYVFCKWVSTADRLMLVVKPSQKLLERAQEVMGYEIVAMVPNELKDGSIRLVGTFRTDLAGFNHDSVLGDIMPDDAASFRANWIKA